MEPGKARDRGNSRQELQRDTIELWSISLLSCSRIFMDILYTVLLASCSISDPPFNNLLCAYT